MSLKNINRYPRFSAMLVQNRVIESRQLVALDVGARGGFEPFLNLYIPLIRKIGFEADPAECERLNQIFFQKNEQYYPYALHRDKGKRTFYVTESPYGGGFYCPNRLYAQRFYSGHNKRVIKTIEMETFDFDTVAQENHIEYVDYVKLDTEGCELDILAGAEKFVRDSFLVINSEAWIQPFHDQQPVFSDLDAHLRARGFFLFELFPYRHERKALPEPNNQSSRGYSLFGQVVWAQVLYFKDFVHDWLHGKKTEPPVSPLDVLKLVSFMELFCFNDCAIELLQMGGQVGVLKEYPVREWVNLLVPPIGSKIYSYEEYMALQPHL